MSRGLTSIQGLYTANVSYRKKAAFVIADIALCNKKSIAVINKSLKKLGNYKVKLVEIKPYKGKIPPPRPRPTTPRFLPPGHFPRRHGKPGASEHNIAGVRRARNLPTLRAIPGRLRPTIQPTIVLPRLQVLQPTRSNNVAKNATPPAAKKPRPRPTPRPTTRPTPRR